MAGERYRYYFERDRVLELHRRIYNEKQRLKSQRALDMCETILEDLINLAFRRAEYKRQRALDMCETILEDLINLAFRRAEYKREYEEEMPRAMLADMAALFVNSKTMPRAMLADMAALFVNSKTMLDLLPVAEVILENDPANEVEEEIYSMEIDRQNVIDDMSLENYCTFTWPWDLNERFPDYKKLYPLHSIDMAMNVLGHIVFRLLLAKYPKPIVFRLLLAKYPKPSPKRPPNIPKVQIAVAINNISDLTIIPILRKLLSEREIKVIQIPEVINYCLSMYKDETTEEYQKLSIIVFQCIKTRQQKNTKNLIFLTKLKMLYKKLNRKKTARKQNPRKKKNGKKAKSEKGKEVKQKGEKKGIKKIPIQEHIESCDPIAYQEKQVQTPKSKDISRGRFEHPTLSSAAKLGKIAYEILQLGEGLNDALVVQMLVEYLKGLKNINGWCLINYPSTLAQSILLEEALTAKTVPLNLEVPNNKSSQDLKKGYQKDSNSRTH
ncbi:hypothetical protein QE152_g13018 [Popillia japonica]|uniref:CPC1/SPEF2 domain-containing protein n=1 Tax=Popillia japonica TaxID=7064 RepID=A0AAW1LFX9_POPJA